MKHPVEKLLYFIKTDVLKKKGKRRYIHPRLGVEGFFRELKTRNISYSVLRWFETLPHVDEGEDIDILFADSEMNKIDDLFKGTKSTRYPLRYLYRKRTSRDLLSGYRLFSGASVKRYAFNYGMAG